MKIARNIVCNWGGTKEADGSSSECGVGEHVGRCRDALDIVRAFEEVVEELSGKVTSLKDLYGR